MATRYEYYISDDDIGVMVYGGSVAGQSFTPQTSHTITSIKLKAYRVGSPGQLVVDVFETDGNGLPLGNAIASGSFNANGLTTSSAGEWFEVTLGAGAGLISSEKYAFTLTVASGDSSNAVRWRVDQSSPNYPRGNLIYAEYLDPDWGDLVNDTDKDAMFEDWGDPWSPASPSVTTQAVTAISGTIATGNGDVTSLGDADVTQHGHCWNTTGTPDTNDSKTENGAKAATGAFTSSLTGLTAGIKYYVRAYAINSAGTSYGNEIVFWADKGTVYPSDAITRVTNLIHRYNRREQDYSLEIASGEVTSDFGLPQWLSRPRPSTPEQEVQQEQEDVAKSPAVKESVQKAIDEVLRPSPPVTETGLPGVTMPFTTRMPTAAEMAERAGMSESEYEKIISQGKAIKSEPPITTIPLVELPQIIRKAKATAALATLQAKLDVFEEAIRLRKLEDKK